MGANQYWFRLTDHIVWKAHELNARPDRKGFVPGESILVRWHAVDGIVLTE